MNLTIFLQVGLEVEVWSVEAVLSATVVEIERNQQRIVSPGPKVGLTLTSLMSPLHCTVYTDFLDVTLALYSVH